MQCSLCDCLSPSVKLYVNHLRSSHSKDPSFHIICGICDCREVFYAFSAFNSHIYRRHRTDMFEGASGSNPNRSNVSENDDDNEDNDDNDDTSIDLNDPSSNQEVQNVDSKDLSSNRIPPQTITAANMILALREGYQVSQVAISEAISFCKVLCEQVIEAFKEDVTCALGIGFEAEQPELETVLQKVYNPFEDIDSNYLFEKFCIDHLGCLVSLCVLCKFDLLTILLFFSFRKQRKYPLEVHTLWTSL